MLNPPKAKGAALQEKKIIQLYAMNFKKYCHATLRKSKRLFETNLGKTNIEYPISRNELIYWFFFSSNAEIAPMVSRHYKV